MDVGTVLANVRFSLIRDLLPLENRSTIFLVIYCGFGESLFRGWFVIAVILAEGISAIREQN